MWPMWKLPLAYGRAVVTKSLRADDVMKAAFSGGTRDFRRLVTRVLWRRALVGVAGVGFAVERWGEQR
ncbi:hypothetical protein D3C71_2022620 [compost metagenome]